MDHNKLKSVAGKFATGVTVVNTMDEDGNIHGVTANSFVSISLNPALVGFFLMETGAFLKRIKPDSRLGINILSAEQKATSNRYAGFDDGSLPQDVFSVIDDCPILEDSIGWYSTVVRQMNKVGDHVFVVCEIINLNSSEKDPLIYYSGYRSIGQII